MTPIGWLLRAALGRPRDLVRSQRDAAAERVLADFAYEQADLLRLGRLTRDEALAGIAARFPRLSTAQVERALAQGLQNSMW